MVIRVRSEDCSEVWDGVFYKKLSDYPNITPWEIRTILEFISYEKQHGRDCTIECADQELLTRILESLAAPAGFLHTPRPALLTECTACPARKGCETEFVCHTTSLENAKSILSSGKLLSAIKARKLPAEVLMAESRNAAADPADYFEYVMLAWGNCQAGDRLVMERMLGRFPNEEDLSSCFVPGIRFYFRYDDLAKHPNVTFDGVLPMKIKDEVFLEDYLFALVIPEKFREDLQEYVPENLCEKVLYIENDCADIWAWAEKVYRKIENFA